MNEKIKEILADVCLARQQGKFDHEALNWLAHFEAQIRELLTEAQDA